MMTVRIVPCSSEQRMRGPRAAGFANIRVITTPAKAPQPLTRAPAIDIQRIRLPPNLLQTEIANITTRVRRRRQRRTALDRPVSLNSERVLTGVTTGPVNPIVTAAAPHRL